VSEQVVGIRFKGSGKTYCFSAGQVEIKRGDRVVVESELGINIGEVADVGCREAEGGHALKPILRLMTEADRLQEEENTRVQAEAEAHARERIASRNLPMKLIATEVTLDRKRFIFYFVAETRIDFRELVKDLASKFRTRIELRQIGIRDAAKLVGGFGICGRDFCCRTFLKGFAPISIKMAKQQDLVLNTCKLSGLCGRLMCCLNYEYYPGEKARRKPARGRDAEPADRRSAGAAVPDEVLARATEPLAEALAEPEPTLVVAEPMPKELAPAATPAAPGESPAGSEDEQKRRRRSRGRRRKKPGTEGAQPDGSQTAARPEAQRARQEARPDRQAGQQPQPAQPRQGEPAPAGAEQAEQARKKRRRRRARKGKPSPSEGQAGQ
jgi:cell fate regulator YaaT (PSP1 superfamily)